MLVSPNLPAYLANLTFEEVFFIDRMLHRHLHFLEGGRGREEN